MEEFGRVGFFAFDSQKNLESHGASRRNGHRSLLSQMVAGFRPVAVDEFLRGHAALALELNFDQLQRRVSVFVFILAAADEQARSLDCDVSGRQLNRMWQASSAVHLQRFALRSE